MDFKKRIIEELKITKIQADTLYKKYVQIVEKLAKEYRTEQLNLLMIPAAVRMLPKCEHKNIISSNGQQNNLLFCAGCGNKKQLIVESDINSQRACKNKLCKQNNCGQHDGTTSFSNDAL